MCVYVLLARSESKMSPSRYGLCAFRASVGGVCFHFTAGGVGGSGRVTCNVTPHAAPNEKPKMSVSIGIEGQ